MGDLYSIHPGISRAGVNSNSTDDAIVGGGPGFTDLIKSQIASHPRYPSLLAAYIECRKVGAPPEIATILEEVAREKHAISDACGEMGADPELDEFMESYCRVLLQYKEELSKPFDDVSSFFTSIETQLRNLCSDGSATAAASAAAAAAAASTTTHSPSGPMKSNCERYLTEESRFIWLRNQGVFRRKLFNL